MYLVILAFLLVWGTVSIGVYAVLSTRNYFIYGKNNPIPLSSILKAVAISLVIGLFIGWMFIVTIDVIYNLRTSWDNF